MVTGQRPRGQEGQCVSAFSLSPSIGLQLGLGGAAPWSSPLAWTLRVWAVSPHPPVPQGPGVSRAVTPLLQQAQAWAGPTWPSLAQDHAASGAWVELKAQLWLQGTK